MPRLPLWKTRNVRGVSSFVQKGRGKNKGLTRVLIPLTGKTIYYYGAIESPITRTIKPLNIRRK